MITEFSELQPNELIQGYFYSLEKQAYCCAVCGQEFPADEVFPFGNRYFTAEKAVSVHIRGQHPNLLEELLSVEPRYLGSIRETQMALFRLMGEGLPDREIAKKLSVSLSTIRHHRFTLREKAKQARLFLAVYGLATAAKCTPQDEVIEIHSGVTMLDDRFVITKAEQEKILSTVFASLKPLKLLRFPAREKQKIVILDQISGEFAFGKKYTEQEVNTILSGIFHDYVTLRRYLIEYGYMERTQDCSAYWKKGGKNDYSK